MRTVVTDAIMQVSTESSGSASVMRIPARKEWQMS